ncbi:unnamed protein product [Paramecium primaurelia]|uniref:Uncharacterized protein n=1 Tax=Paramecium primaurelia TaxID=5886 RepID=A0A8S1JZJ5_PARPR|nr:unnamed protein product [Paramecium primaurelia]
MKPLVISNSQINKHEQANKGQNRILRYEDKKVFQENFFKKSRLQQEPQNFQQYFYFNNVLQNQRKQMIIENTDQELQENQLNGNQVMSIQEKIINYIIEYQQQQQINKKYTYVKRKMYEELRIEESKIIQQKGESESVSTDCSNVEKSIYQQELSCEKSFTEYLRLGFENFYKGEFSQILFQENYISPKQIIINLNKALQQFNECNKKKMREDLRVCYIGISEEFNFHSIQEEKDFQFLQSFSFMIQNEQSLLTEPQQKQNINNLIQKNQYYIKLNVSNKITNQIHLLYKYFLKCKIRQFKPKIIILFLEINDFIDFETYYFQKLIAQLEKISQHSLMVIPLLSMYSPQNYEKYLKCAVLITNSCLDYSYKRKNKAYYQCDDISAQQYKEYSQYFAQTQKEQQFFARQYLALKVRNNKYQSNDMDIENQQENYCLPYGKSVQNEQKKNIVEQEFQLNVIGILNLKNQIILTKIYEKQSQEPIKISEVQYFISYNQDKKQFIICIIKDDQLFYQICSYNTESETQIEDSIYLDEYRYFKVLKKNCKSSYLLLDSNFYQFNVIISIDKQTKQLRNHNSGFQYFVQVYKYNLNEIQQPQKYFNQEPTQQNTYNLINFTITELEKNKFIVLGGSYQSFSEFQDFNLRTCSIIIEIDEKNQNKLKITENIGKLKSYENSIAQKIDNFSLIYFESQTQYLTAPIQSQFQKLSIFGAQSKLQTENYSILNQEIFEFYQKKKKLFKSNQLNSKIISQNKKQLVFVVVVQELVQDNQKILDQENSINVKFLSKQVQLQTHKFQFIIEFAKQTIDIQYETYQFIIEQIEKTNSLRESCLYVNWLEDRNNQYIFPYNGVQNLYLLYFHDKPTPKTRKFIFEDPKDKEDYIDFDEVILNDLDNEQLWIVRKINHQDHISLALFESDWINLQEVKDSQEDSITKVPISFIFTIAQIKEDFCLIGLEVKWQIEQGKKCPYLIVCTSNQIYEISIQMIRKVKWDNILRYKPNTWEKEPLEFQQSPIYKQKQVQFNINMQIPTIVASLENGDLLLFYSYCNVNKEVENQYQLEIQYLILKNLNQQDNERIDYDDGTKEFKFKTIKYNSKKEVNIAKINAVIISKNEFEFSVIVEESDSNLYKVFSGNDSKDKKQLITIMKECKILNDAAPLKNQCIIVSQDTQNVYHLQ